MTKFDPTKPVRTRDGRLARIVCTTARGDYPIIALRTHPDGSEYVVYYTLKGEYFAGSVDRLYDLINISEKRFVNIWEKEGQYKVSSKPYATAEEAKNIAETFTNSNYYVAIAVEVEV